MERNFARHHRNDQLLSALVQALARNQSDSVLQAVLILAFMPARHRTSRDVSFLFPSLYEQDVSQQVLATFLRVSLSPSIQRRTGFMPIAITRTVRKIVFRWAFREVRSPELKVRTRNPARAPLISRNRTLSSPICFFGISSSIASAREFFPPPSSTCSRN